MQSFISWLEALSRQIPVTWFVFIGSLLEEIIAPIPSPLVMLLGGSISAGQGSPQLFIGLLALIGALSKTFGSLLIYIISDKAEDVVIDKFGKFLGVSHTDTEGLGKFFGQGKRDDIAIFLLRAVPVMPTAPVSVIAGLIKIDLKTYLVSTFLGLMVRNLIYLYLGYTSLGTLESLSEGFDSLEKIGYLILAVFAGVVLLWMYRKRRQGSVLSMMESMIDRVKRIFKK
ncbi:VTT domain-containing protein [Candidatus Woesebacteria bacterium]|nr:VTT domain-containing protein [Candidatus Woesebacteria bacterium]